ncbi:hypothetical protein TRIUR3_14006 [Triticum urartu]|uniref:Uncharacterized protein n=2 Tax=Triticum TaxID=4564 RepID=A0A9R0WKY1_TRITD|nr:hypothetical protein TRIUR3_14006 [Triticum urartu]VAI14192.1 unnamed protein product [Triticum turgidum subsp. durum]
MSKFAVGEASTVPAASFRRAEAGLLAHPELHAVRRVLDSMRSDPDKFWECRGRGLKNKAGRRIPAHILARCFMRRSSGRFCKEFRSGIMSKGTAASSPEG